MRIRPNNLPRRIEIGGLTKLQLIQVMQQHSIAMNEYAKILLSDKKFTTSDTKYHLQIVEITAENLGFSKGATLPQIFTRAIEQGFELCPLELGPHLRLEYLDQPEGYIDNPSTQNQAPSGSITVASEIISEDEDFPKGFYLRKIDGVLWLRGYTADHQHLWNPDDCFVFANDKK